MVYSSLDRRGISLASVSLSTERVVKIVPQKNFFSQKKIPKIFFFKKIKKIQELGRLFRVWAVFAWFGVLFDVLAMFWVFFF